MRWNWRHTSKLRCHLARDVDRFWRTDTAAPDVAPLANAVTDAAADVISNFFWCIDDVPSNCYWCFSWNRMPANMTNMIRYGKSPVSWRYKIWYQID